MTNVRRPIHLQLRPPPPCSAGGSPSSLANGLNQNQSVSRRCASFMQNTQNGTPKQALSPTSPDSLPSQIMPHLFVGGLEQTNRETVNRLNIKYILSLGLLPLVIHQNNTQHSSGPTVGAQHQNSASTNQTKEAHSAGLNLMPSQNCSKDYKIRIRSNTPSTTPATPTGGCSPSSACFPHVLLEQTGSPATLCHAATNGTPRKQQAPASNGQSSQQQQQQQQQQQPQQQAATNLRDENKGVKQVRSVYCKCINVADNSDQLLMKFFDEAYCFIEEARRKKCNILIHCLAGISRSPTIAIAYLMRIKGMHWRDAYDLVKQSRPQIDPNLSFMGQLRIYNKSLANNCDTTTDETQQHQVQSATTNNTNTTNSSFPSENLCSNIKHQQQQQTHQQDKTTTRMMMIEQKLPHRQLTNSFDSSPTVIIATLQQQHSAK